MRSARAYRHESGAAQAGNRHRRAGHRAGTSPDNRDSYDLVIVEGAGSPAEINLRKGDIANMGFAEAANVPVILCGDIDRGGVIAQIVGTQAVLDPADAARVHGFIINKFRGDPRLFDDGYVMVEAHTGWRGFGVGRCEPSILLLIPLWARWSASGAS